MSDANPALDPIGYRCTGCGHLTKLPSADLSAIRAKGGRSCCPERNMVGLSDRIEELERMLGLADDQRREWERHCKKAEAKLAECEARLEKAVELAFDECPFRDGTGSYGDWWRYRRKELEALKGQKDE